MTSAKRVINLYGGSHTSKPYSSQIRRQSRADKRIKFVVGNYFLNPYSVQIACKSRDNTPIPSHGGNCVSNSYADQTDCSLNAFCVKCVANWSAEFRITVLEFYHLQRVMFQLLFITYRAPIRSFLIWSKSCLDHIFCTVKLNVEMKYTNYIICSTSCFETIFSTDWLYVECQCTWSESCFGSIFRTDSL